MLSFVRYKGSVYDGKGRHTVQQEQPSQEVQEHELQCPSPFMIDVGICSRNLVCVVCS